MKKINKKRLADLLRSEYILSALLRCGLKNWDQYNFVMNETEEGKAANGLCGMTDDDLTAFYDDI